MREGGWAIAGLTVQRAGPIATNRADHQLSSDRLCLRHFWRYQPARSPCCCWNERRAYQTFDLRISSRLPDLKLYARYRAANAENHLLAWHKYAGNWSVSTG
jgi:hypothetical protein